jgi:hypothetical protein
MLNLMVTMRSAAPLFLLTLFLLALIFAPVQLAWAQTPQPPVAITAPGTGAALQGVVTVQGTSAVDGFQEADISFAYADNPTHIWFPLAHLDKPSGAGALASWDTTTITDGDYVLRLRVFLADGTVQTVQVNGLRVRNYTPIETREPTLTLTATHAAAMTSATHLSTPQPATVTPSATHLAGTPTALPTNPAQITFRAVGGSLAQGAVAAFGLFVGLGFYLGLKALWRKF